MKPQVSLMHCGSYQDPEVETAIRGAVDAIGGISEVVQPGQRVVLKANLLRAAGPEAALSTHPSVVKAVVRLVQEAGGHPIIADSPGGPYHASWLRAVYRQTGMTQVAEETGAELNWDFGQRMVPHPEGHMVKGLEVANFVLDADVVIALPKLKTHTFMQYTGATKILFGIIPGTLKLGYHARFSEPRQFGNFLIDVLELIRPALTIMDSVVAMDGQGPSAGDPFPVGAVLASHDAVALDIVATALVGLDIKDIHPLVAAVERGLTSGEVRDIDIIGNSLTDFRVEGFRRPGTQTTHGRLLRRLGVSGKLTSVFYRQMSPAPRANGDCIGCGICARSCPVSAITVVNAHAQMDLSTCIRCYCCHELCPEHAIDLQKPWLRRVADRL